ncbi:MAG: ATP12 family protein [Pseudomonadota bacterium]
MSLIKAKRFWTDVTVVQDGEGWAVELDGRRVSTPAKTALALPTQAAAQLVADEWQAVEETIDPSVMPAARWANSAVDKVVPQRDGVIAMLAEYGGSDLLCYRADGPAALQAQQAAAWDGPLAWAANTLQAPLTVTNGISPIAQPKASLENLAGALGEFDPFALAAVHDLVTISGSLVLGLAVAKGALSTDAAWDASRVDDAWQISQWGADEDAESLTASKKKDVDFAARALLTLGHPVS